MMKSYNLFEQDKIQYVNSNNDLEKDPYSIVEKGIDFICKKYNINKLKCVPEFHIFKVMYNGTPNDIIRVSCPFLDKGVLKKHNVYLSRILGDIIADGEDIERMILTDYSNQKDSIIKLVREKDKKTNIFRGNGKPIIDGWYKSCYKDEKGKNFIYKDENNKVAIFDLEGNNILNGWYAYFEELPDYRYSKYYIVTLDNGKKNILVEYSKRMLLDRDYENIKLLKTGENQFIFVCRASNKMNSDVDLYDEMFIKIPINVHGNESLIVTDTLVDPEYEKLSVELPNLTSIERKTRKINLIKNNGKNWGDKHLLFKEWCDKIHIPDTFDREILIAERNKKYNIIFKDYNLITFLEDNEKWFDNAILLKPTVSKGPISGETIFAIKKEGKCNLWIYDGLPERKFLLDKWFDDILTGENDIIVLVDGDKKYMLTVVKGKPNLIDIDFVGEGYSHNGNSSYIIKKGNKFTMMNTPKLVPFYDSFDKIEAFHTRFPIVYKNGKCTYIELFPVGDKGIDYLKFGGKVIWFDEAVPVDDIKDAMRNGFNVIENGQEKVYMVRDTDIFFR